MNVPVIPRPYEVKFELDFHTATHFQWVCTVGNALAEVEWDLMA